MFTHTAWLGTRDSYSDALRMQKAKEDGTLLQLMASNPELQALSRSSDDENFRIGQTLLTVVEGVAVVSVKGGLVSDYAWYNSWFGLVSYQEIRDAIELALEDENVKKIMLDVDSPGGAVSGLDELGDFIYKVDQSIKPVEGHTSSHAHSAGYWLLCSCRKINASKMASLGSVGVIMTLVNYSKMLKDEGIEFHYFRSGKFKALGQVGEELSDEAKAEFMSTVMQLHEFFMAQVIRGRGSLAQQNSSQWKEGKTFLAKQAKEIGLVDEINTFDVHIAKLVQNSNNKFALSSKNNTLSEDADMKLKSLSPELQAKLAAGTPLDQLGLSAEDLAKAQEEIKKMSEEEGSPAEEKASDSDTPEAEASDTEGDNPKDEEANPNGSAEDSSTNTLMQLNSDLNKKLARAEIKLEEEEKKSVQLQETIVKLEEVQTKLATVVGEALGKLQVAVGSQATSLEGLGVEALLTQYAAAKQTFEATFKVGATSKQTVESRDSQESLKPNNPIRKIN